MKKQVWVIIMVCLGITGCAAKEDKDDTEEISYVEESSAETKEEETPAEDDTLENLPFPYDEERKQFYYTLDESEISHAF